MPLDWSRIGTGNQQPLLRPRDIFNALPARKWTYLRQEQGEILESWFKRREDRDIVIKQNTGGGKTVAGLLIAQSSSRSCFREPTWPWPRTTRST